jgi:hypothetical protein
MYGYSPYARMFVDATRLSETISSWESRPQRERLGVLGFNQARIAAARPMVVAHRWTLKKKCERRITERASNNQRVLGRKKLEKEEGRRTRSSYPFGWQPLPPLAGVR